MPDDRRIEYQIKVTADAKGGPEAAAAIDRVTQATQAATRATKEQQSAAQQQQPAQQAAATTAEKTAEATKKAAGTLEELKRAGGPATQILQGLSQAAAGGVQSISGLANVGKGLVAALFGGFGPAGIIATAGGVVLGLVAALLRVKQPAEDASKGLKEVADAAKEMEAATLETFLGQVDKLNRDLDAMIEKQKFALEQNKAIEDATTAANIASVRAQVAAGSLSKDKGDKAIRGFELAQQLRNTRAPAERAALERQAAEGRAAIDAETLADLQARYRDVLSALEEYNIQVIRARTDLEAASEEWTTVVTGEATFQVKGNAERMKELADQIASDERAIAEANARLAEITNALADARESAEISEKEAAAARDREKGAKETATTISAIQAGTAATEQAGAAGAAAAGKSRSDAQAREEKRIAGIVAAEERRRAQADREIADEIASRQGRPLPNFELPPEASRPGSGFDVKDYNRQQAERFRSGADLREAEERRRAEFDAFRKRAEANAKTLGKDGTTATPAPAPATKPDTSLGGSSKGAAGPGGGTIDVGGAAAQPTPTPLAPDLPQTGLRGGEPGSMEVGDPSGRRRIIRSNKEALQDNANEQARFRARDDGAKDGKEYTGLAKAVAIALRDVSARIG